MHKGPIGGKHAVPISSLPTILLDGAPYSGLWDLGIPLMLVLFPFLAFSLVACSLENYIILKTVILQIIYLANCHLTSNLWLVLLFTTVGSYVRPHNPKHRSKSDGVPSNKGLPCGVDFA